MRKFVNDIYEGIWIGKKLEYDILGNIEKTSYYLHGSFKMVDYRFVLDNAGDLLLYNQSLYKNNREIKKSFYQSDDKLVLYWTRNEDFPLTVERIGLNYYKNQINKSKVSYFNEDNEKISFTDFKSQFNLFFKLDKIFDKLSPPTVGDDSSLNKDKDIDKTIDKDIISSDKEKDDKNEKDNSKTEEPDKEKDDKNEKNEKENTVKEENKKKDSENEKDDKTKDKKIKDKS